MKRFAVFAVWTGLCVLAAIELEPSETVSTFIAVAWLAVCGFLIVPTSPLERLLSWWKKE